MKKWLMTALMFLLLLSASGCGKKSINQIIESEPSITGIVEEVYDQSILIRCEELTGYHGPVDCKVSLDVENKDSMTHFNVGDKVRVYFDGNIAESDPLQINTVYAILLIEPADRNIE